MRGAGVEVLVTGATGFLGTVLCRELEVRAHRVVRLGSRNCDLTKPDSLDAFSDRRYDLIFHLAAWTQAGDFCLYHPAEQWVINQLINTHVLRWWQRTQPQAKLVCMGTSCSYAPDGDLREENYLTGTPIDGLFTYAMTKRMMYVGLLAMQKQFGLEHLTFVPSTLYGPDYHWGAAGRQMHFIFDLIQKILEGKRSDAEVTLWGDGYQRRELVFVDDFVRIVLTLVSESTNDLINIGAGEEHTIRHFAELICKEVGYDFERIRFDTTRYVGARSKCLAVDKFRSLMPNCALTPLAVGLRETIQRAVANMGPKSVA